jgi:cellulose synthase (UDP-forming)
MFAISNLSAAFAGVAVVLGIRFLIMPHLNPKKWYWRTLLLGGTTLLAWRYIFWRFDATLPPLSGSLEAIVSWSFACLECLTILSSTIAFGIMTRRKDRTTEADANANWWGTSPAPKVDVFIATYNEQLEVLERTILGAKRLAYKKVRIFVLDDGRRPWLKEACDSFGVGYFGRPTNEHAKAGNINYALSARAIDADKPDFIAVLDADFIPHTNFVDRALALFHDPSVGLVQTPQHFFNADPIQHNLGISTAYPDEQRHFFDNVQPSRDAWGIAFCCGTSSMVRTCAIETIGGMPTESVTEDFLLTLKLAEKNWKSVYLNEPLTEGLAPEGLQEYIVQRGRWCLGMMQIARNIYNPLGSMRMAFSQRLSVFDSVLYWVTTFAFRLASMICPLLYWWCGLTVVNATVPDIVSFYLPYYVAVMATLNWLSKGLFIPVLNDVSQLIAAWAITRAVAIGLLTKGPHKFSVTAKGGDRTKVIIQWPVMRPFLVLIGLTVGGLLVSLQSDFIFNTASAAGDGKIIVMFWTIYNLLVLLVAISACIERPRANRPQRQAVEPIVLILNGREHAGWLLNLGLNGARISGPSMLTLEAEGRLRIESIGDVPARVLKTTRDGYRLSLTPTLGQREMVNAKLHTMPAAPGTDAGDIGLMIKELARALTR